jgi:alkanesulfonate monooxygenase SsuD/methylene tetrahydromethanopterin reductase-like flavin-dependent oxidoreductase (luciferase family)
VGDNVTASTRAEQGPLGCAIPPFESFDAAVRLARLADELGYDSVNLSHIAARDSFSVAAALAARTDRVTLGTSVVPIYTRSPAAMAQAAATVDDVSGGRFRLGIGVGHRETMGAWHGQEIGRPTAEMREYLTIVRAILEGKPPPHGERWASSFAFRGFAPRPNLAIYQAALSPAMLRLAGEIADGVVLWATPADYVRDVVVPEVAAGRARAGKPADGFDILAAVPSAVVDGDPATAFDGIRTELHRYFGLPFYRAMFEAAGFGADLAAYDNSAPDAEAQKLAISDAFISHLCAFGDEDAVRRGVQRYRDAGVTQPILTPVLGTDYGSVLRVAAPARAPAGSRR